MSNAGRLEYLTRSTMPVHMLDDLMGQLGQCPRLGCALPLTRLRHPRGVDQFYVCCCCDVGDRKDCPHRDTGVKP